MLEITDRFFVVTGGPGAGKSTPIDALAKLGYACSIEAGRTLIQDQVSIGSLAVPWNDRALFAELMLSRDMRSYRIAQQSHGPVFSIEAWPMFWDIFPSQIFLFHRT